MEVNPLRGVLTAKATTFVGLSMLVVVVMLVIAPWTPWARPARSQSQSPSQRT
jgi:hypothetical protein